MVEVNQKEQNSEADEQEDRPVSADDMIFSHDLLLNLLNNINPKSEIAYRIGQSFDGLFRDYAEEGPVFPLRTSIITKQENPDLYVKLLAHDEEKTVKDYFAQWQSSLRNPAKRIQHDGRRYSLNKKPEKMEKGLNKYDHLFLKTYFEVSKKLDEIRAVEQGIPFLKNFEKLTGALGLQETDKDVLKFLIARTQDPSISIIMDAIGEGYDTQIQIAAKMLNITEVAFISAIAPEGDLQNKAFINHDDKANLPLLTNRLLGVMENGGVDEFIQGFSGRVYETDLNPSDYPHAKDDIDIISSILKKATDERQTGINFLIWGEADVGKNDFAAMIASTVGAKMYRPGETHSEFREVNNYGDRLNVLYNVDLLMGGTKEAVFALGDLDDIINSHPQSHHNVMSIVAVNQVPTIWIADRIDGIAPELLQAFTYSVKVPLPSANVRTGIYQRLAQRMDREIAPEIANDLGKSFEVAPILIKKALAFDQLVNPQGSVNRDNVANSLRKSALLLRGSENAFDVQDAYHEVFNPKLVNVFVRGHDKNSEIDMADFGRRLKGSKDPITCLFHGISGGGKTACAKHIAVDILGKEICEKNFGQLTEKYIGDSERLIAEAFNSAAQKNQVLIINEADSLMTNRSNRKDDVVTNGVVNHMLIELEKTKVPVILTTNLKGHIDPAFLRRFNFKFEFDFLKPEQIPLCYEEYFKNPLPANSVLSQLKMTAGDFANVLKNMKYEDTVTDQLIENKLMAEAVGRENVRGLIGFPTAANGGYKV